MFKLISKPINLDNSFTDIIENFCIQNDTFLNIIKKFRLFKLHTIRSALSMYNLYPNQTISQIEKTNKNNILNVLDRLFIVKFGIKNHSKSILNVDNQLIKQTHNKMFLVDSIELNEKIKSSFENLSKKFQINKELSIEDNLSKLNYTLDSFFVEFFNDYVVKFDAKFVEMLSILNVSTNMAFNKYNTSIDTKLSDWLKISSKQQQQQQPNRSKLNKKIISQSVVHSQYGRSLSSRKKLKKSASRLNKKSSLSSNNNEINKTASKNSKEFIDLIELTNKMFFDLNISIHDIINSFNNYISKKMYCHSDDFFKYMSLCMITKTTTMRPITLSSQYYESHLNTVAVKKLRKFKNISQIVRLCFCSST